MLANTRTKDALISPVTTGSEGDETTPLGNSSVENTPLGNKTDVRVEITPQTQTDESVEITPQTQTDESVENTPQTTMTPPSVESTPLWTPPSTTPRNAWQATLYQTLLRGPTDGIGPPLPAGAAVVGIPRGVQTTLSQGMRSVGDQRSRERWRATWAKTKPPCGSEPGMDPSEQAVQTSLHSLHPANPAPTAPSACGPDPRTGPHVQQTAPKKSGNPWGWQCETAFTAAPLGTVEYLGRNGAAYHGCLSVFPTPATMPWTTRQARQLQPQLVVEGVEMGTMENFLKIGEDQPEAAIDNTISMSDFFSRNANAAKTIPAPQSAAIPVPEIIFQKPADLSGDASASKMIPAPQHTAIPSDVIPVPEIISQTAAGLPGDASASKITPAPQRAAIPVPDIVFQTSAALLGDAHASKMIPALQNAAIPVPEIIFQTAADLLGDAIASKMVLAPLSDAIPVPEIIFQKATDLPGDGSASKMTSAPQGAHISVPEIIFQDATDLHGDAHASKMIPATQDTVFPVPEIIFQAETVDENASIMIPAVQVLFQYADTLLGYRNVSTEETAALQYDIPESPIIFLTEQDIMGNLSAPDAPVQHTEVLPELAEFFAEWHETFPDKENPVNVPCMDHQPLNWTPKLLELFNKLAAARSNAPEVPLITTVTYVGNVATWESADENTLRDEPDDPSQVDDLTVGFPQPHPSADANADQGVLGTPPEASPPAETPEKTLGLTSSPEEPVYGDLSVGLNQPRPSADTYADQGVLGTPPEASPPAETQKRELGLRNFPEEPDHGNLPDTSKDVTPDPQAWGVLLFDQSTEQQSGFTYLGLSGTRLTEENENTLTESRQNDWTTVSIRGFEVRRTFLSLQVPPAQPRDTPARTWTSSPPSPTCSKVALKKEMSLKE
ncbi:hypothetical protein T484DRAFT_3631153 [Baffinella frigidus]|nr:hypothetical protein T484DRAFT_3631153 [Cryptophyta sp. CCMP2293]